MERRKSWMNRFQRVVGKIFFVKVFSNKDYKILQRFPGNYWQLLFRVIGLALLVMIIPFFVSIILFVIFISEVVGVFELPLVSSVLILGFCISLLFFLVKGEEYIEKSPAYKALDLISKVKELKEIREQDPDFFKNSWRLRQLIEKAKVKLEKEKPDTKEVESISELLENYQEIKKEEQEIAEMEKIIVSKKERLEDLRKKI